MAGRSAFRPIKLWSSALRPSHTRRRYSTASETCCSAPHLGCGTHDPACVGAGNILNDTRADGPNRFSTSTPSVFDLSDVFLMPEKRRRKIQEVLGEAAGGDPRPALRRCEMDLHIQAFGLDRLYPGPGNSIWHSTGKAIARGPWATCSQKTIYPIFESFSGPCRIRVLGALPHSDGALHLSELQVASRIRHPAAFGEAVPDSEPTSASFSTFRVPLSPSALPS